MTENQQKRLDADNKDRLELVRADLRTVLDMTLTYRMYHVHRGELDGFAIQAEGPDGRTPLYFFDHYAARADAFYTRIVESDVFPCTLGDILEEACGEFSSFTDGKNPDFSLQIAKNMVK